MARAATAISGHDFGRLPLQIDAGTGYGSKRRLVKSLIYCAADH